MQHAPITHNDPVIVPAGPDAAEQSARILLKWSHGARYCAERAASAAQAAQATARETLCALKELAIQVSAALAAARRGSLAELHATSRAVLDMCSAQLGAAARLVETARRLHRAAARTHDAHRVAIWSDIELGRASVEAAGSLRVALWSMSGLGDRIAGAGGCVAVASTSLAIGAHYASAIADAALEPPPARDPPALYATWFINVAARANALGRCAGGGLMAHPDRIRASLAAHAPARAPGGPLAVVSAGAGSGTLEAVLERCAGGGLAVYRVGPAPGPWEGPAHMAPAAPSAEDLARQAPELVGAAALLLQYEQPYRTRYGVDAVAALRPPLIVATWARGGTSGGGATRRWWADEDCDGDGPSGYELVEAATFAAVGPIAVFTMYSVWVRAEAPAEAPGAPGAPAGAPAAAEEL